MSLIYYLLYYVMATLTHYFICNNTQLISLSKTKKKILFLVLLLMNILLFPLINQLLMPLLILVELFFILYKREYKFCNLFSFLGGYFFTICLDYLLRIVVFYFFHLSITDLWKKELILYSIILTSGTFLGTRIIAFLLYKKFNIHKLYFSRRFLLSLLGNLLIIVLLFVINIIFESISGYKVDIFLFNSKLFLLYFVLSNILFFFTYKTIYQDEIIKNRLQQFESLKQYILEIEKTNCNMRKFKHDYINILTSMKEYIDNNETQKLEKFFYQKIIPLNKKLLDQDTHLGILENLNSSELKSLVYVKFVFAAESNLQTSLEIVDPITYISMDIVDLLRIIGIFFDNAIEASIESKERELSLAIINNISSVTFILKNTSVPLVVPVSILSSSNYTTKGSQRGYGLYNVNQILSLYSNILWSMEYDEPNFIQTLTIINVK